MKDLLFVIAIAGLSIINYIIIKKFKNKIVRMIPSILFVIIDIICFGILVINNEPIGIKNTLTLLFIGIFSTILFIISLIFYFYINKKAFNSKTDI